MSTGELGVIDDAVTILAARPEWSRRDVDVVADCEAVHRLEQRLAAVRLALVGELDARGLARDLGATSTIAWLRWRLRIPGPAAARMLRLARALRSHPATTDALTSGNLTVDQAHAITESMAAINDAALHDPAPDTATHGDAAHGDAAHGDAAPRHAGVGDGGPAGGLPAEIVERVEALLIDHASRLDPSALQVAGRHALATLAPSLIEELERRALADADRRARQRRRLDLHDDGLGGTVLRGYLDREGAAVLRTALGPLCGLRGIGDERQAGRRRADALVEICQKAMTGGASPARGGQPTQVVITTHFDVLRQALGARRTDAGDHLDPATVRRMACDAMILPAVLGGDGQVLDVGRARRLFTGATRRALAIRDQGCAFPGCDRPPDWCDAHHLRSWLDGGQTNLDNGVFVCRIHHRLLHEPNGWQVILGPDRLPTFIPPKWIDPDQRPLRNIRLTTRAP
ncbi:DUF222 domain-containing protein [Luedemannella flava]